jgi:hypothetical protein
MRRSLGALLIVLGCVILIVDVSSIDVVAFSLSASHGIHVSDLIGGAAVVAGIATLWIAPPRSSD